MEVIKVIETNMAEMRRPVADFDLPLQAQIPGGRAVYLVFIQSDTPISPPRVPISFKGHVARGNVVAMAQDCGGDLGFARLFGPDDRPEGTLDDLSRV